MAKVEAIQAQGADGIGEAGSKGVCHTLNYCLLCSEGNFLARTAGRFLSLLG